MPRPVHFEIHADHPERAIDFYTSLFGWKFDPYMPDFYWAITTGEEGTPGINGGLVRRTGLPPALDAPVHGYVCTVDVPSLDDLTAMIEKSNCPIVLPRQAIPGVGWLIYFKDTEGNLVGAMENDPNAA